MTIQEARVACGKSRREMGRELVMSPFKYCVLEWFPGWISATEALAVAQVVGVEIDDLDFTSRKTRNKQ